MPMLDGKEMERRLKEILEKTQQNRNETVKVSNDDKNSNQRRV